MDTLKEGFEGERRPKDKVALRITLVCALTFTRPKTFTHGHVNEFDKYFHWTCVNVNSLDV
jgi:hypothetical protein